MKHLIRGSVIDRLGEGKFLPDNESQFKRVFKSFINKDVDVIVEEHKDRRSLEQNKLMWVWIGLLGEHLGYTKGDMHRVLLGEHFGTKEIEYNGKVYLEPLQGSSGLKVKEMTEHLEWIEQFAVTMDVILPRPEEINL